MPSIPKSDANTLPFELVNLQHWFALAYASTQQATTFIDAYQPRTPEGEALKDIYHDVLAVCLDTMREAATAHLPDELAALLAFQHAELEAMEQQRHGQRHAAGAPAAAD